jgi:hypothetical protein
MHRDQNDAQQEEVGLTRKTLLMADPRSSYSGRRLAPLLAHHGGAAWTRRKTATVRISWTVASCFLNGR